jgi:hypothetical protein
MSEKSKPSFSDTTEGVHAEIPYNSQIQAFNDSIAQLSCANAKDVQYIVHIINEKLRLVSLYFEPSHGRERKAKKRRRR